MRHTSFMDFVVGTVFFLLLMSIPTLIGFFIYKELHCWGLDPKTAPIECQNTNTVNVNGLE